jgi:hypothetical protein
MEAWKKLKSGVEKVCEDLRQSCVSDIFLAFKSDFPGKGCGEVGTPLFRTERETFERLISSCFGMNMHAWVPIFHDKYFIDNNGGPEKVGQRASIFGQASYSKEYADPENGIVVEYQLSLIQEILSTYDLTGLNLDFIRYSEEQPDKVRIIGFELTPNWEVKPSAIESFVARARERIVSLRPDMVLSADVMPDTFSRDKVGQTRVPSLVDVVIPMSYSRFGTTTRGIGELKGDSGASRQLETVEMRTNLELLKMSTPGRQIIPVLRGWGDGIYPTNDYADDLIADLGEDIDICKNMSMDGFAIFTYEAALYQTSIPKLDELNGKIGY